MNKIVLLIVAVLTSIPIISSLNASVHDNALDIYGENGLKNTVTTVYLKNRMYDTVFEVLVFSTVALGIHTFHSGEEKGTDRIREKVFSDVFAFVSFAIGMVSVYLALYGHVYPGGGFTAGVAGGTALLLAGMRMGVDEFEKKYEDFKVERFERIVVVTIIFLAVLEFLQIVGSNAVPVQSTLVFLKVTGSTWIIIYTFIKHRGIV